MYSKDEVMKLAKDYVEEHGYVNLSWFITEKLQLKVPKYFIKKVRAKIIEDKRYIQKGTHINRNPDYLSQNLPLEREKVQNIAATSITKKTGKFIANFIIGVIVSLIAGIIFYYMIKWKWF